MPAREPDQPRKYKVGDRVLASLSSGPIEEAIVKAVIQQADETRLLIHTFQGH